MKTDVIYLKNGRFYNNFSDYFSFKTRENSVVKNEKSLKTYVNRILSGANIVIKIINNDYYTKLYEFNDKFNDNFPDILKTLKIIAPDIVSEGVEFIHKDSQNGDGIYFYNLKSNPTELHKDFLNFIDFLNTTGLSMNIYTTIQPSFEEEIVQYIRTIQK